ncbi:MAG TPA: hypothetical protein VI297_06035, partial [Gemmatimonadales bacterium]
QKIGSTAAPVLSRLQRFDFRRIGPGPIRDRLKDVLAQEHIAADDDALTLIARHADGGMRDALSMLDQCLSFGDGGVTAARAREILGLAGDERYAEALALVAERRPAAVFPLVEQLMSSGADLAEFMGGVGEMLRALLMVQLGAEPEDLTEAMRETLGRYRDRLAPGDVLRMLKLLADNETAVRRSGNPRLAVETLLLRWAMLDRVVDLAQVLAGGAVDTQRTERRAAPAHAGPDGPAPASGPSLASGPARASGPAPAPVPAADPGRLAPSSLPSGVDFSVPALRSAWPAVVAAVRERKPFLAEAVATAEPAEAAPPWLTVRIPESGGLFVQALQEHVGLIEEIIGRVVGQAVRLRVVSGSPPDAGTGAAAAPRRMSDASIRAERLSHLRAKDPALDTAAEALDLEIVE